MKPWIPLLLAAALLSGCAPETKQAEPAAQAAPSGQAAQAAPQVSLPSAAEAEAVNFEYTPTAAKQTLYFNASGQAAEHAAAGGFYREILGRTADGRTVAQDFYQDIAKRQTAPFILKAGADPKDFSSEAMDSKGVWYRPDGSLFYLQNYQNGKEHGPATYYQDGLPLIQSHDAGLRSLFFYNDGKILGELLVKNPESADMEQILTLFRTNGSAIVRAHTRGQETVSAAYWDAAGQSSTLEAVRNSEELLPLLQRVETLQSNLFNMHPFVMGEAAAASSNH